MGSESSPGNASQQPKTVFIWALLLLFSPFRMSQGRCSATFATVMLLCLLVLHSGVADAATYTVGGVGGWTFNTVSWPRGKRFRAGDTLVFSYNPKFHNVVVVNQAGYDRCTAPPGAKVYHSGNDQIRLVKGPNYFICSYPGHCQSGMKIAAITVWLGSEI